MEQSRSHDLSSSDRSGCQTLPHLTVYSTEDDRGRRSTSLPPSAETRVEELQRQFESLSSSSPTPPVTPEDADGSHVTSCKHHMVTSSGTETDRSWNWNQNGTLEFEWELGFGMREYDVGVRNWSTVCLNISIFFVCTVSHVLFLVSLSLHVVVCLCVVHTGVIYVHTQQL